MPTCQGTTRRGTPCCLSTPSSSTHCHLHIPRPDCAICLQVIAPSTVYHIGCPGKHVFHKACINAWFLDHDTCPMCRAEVANPLPIIFPRPSAHVQNPPVPDFGSIATFVQLSLRDDPTKRVSLYFNFRTGHMEEALFWHSDSDDDGVLYFYIDGNLRTVISRWW